MFFCCFSAKLWFFVSFFFSSIINYTIYILNRDRPSLFIEFNLSSISIIFKKLWCKVWWNEKQLLCTFCFDCCTSLVIRVVNFMFLYLMWITLFKWELPYFCMAKKPEMFHLNMLYRPLWLYSEKMVIICKTWSTVYKYVCFFNAVNIYNCEN